MLNVNVLYKNEFIHVCTLRILLKNRTKNLIYVVEDKYY